MKFPTPIGGVRESSHIHLRFAHDTPLTDESFTAMELKLDRKVSNMFGICIRCLE
jgi:hypothetical protein